jgi:hypothetical protein
MTDGIRLSEATVEWGEGCQDVLVNLQSHRQKRNPIDER